MALVDTRVSGCRFQSDAPLQTRQHGLNIRPFIDCSGICAYKIRICGHLSRSDHALAQTNLLMVAVVFTTGSAADKAASGFEISFACRAHAAGLAVGVC
jgi:hypothetical protein